MLGMNVKTEEAQWGKSKHAGLGSTTGQHIYMAVRIQAYGLRSGNAAKSKGKTSEIRVFFLVSFDPIDTPANLDLISLVHIVCGTNVVATATTCIVILLFFLFFFS